MCEVISPENNNTVSYELLYGLSSSSYILEIQYIWLKCTTHI